MLSRPYISGAIKKNDEIYGQLPTDMYIIYYLNQFIWKGVSTWNPHRIGYSQQYC